MRSENKDRATAVVQRIALSQAPMFTGTQRNVPCRRMTSHCANGMVASSTIPPKTISTMAAAESNVNRSVLGSMPRNQATDAATAVAPIHNHARL